LTANGWSPETEKAYRADLKVFADFLRTKGVRFDRVCRGTVAEFEAEMKSRGLSDSTISRRRAALSSFYEFLRSGGSKVPNPTHGRLRHKRGSRTLADLEGKAIDQSHIDALLTGVTVPRDRALFLLLLNSGLRLAEVHQLNIDSIEEQNMPLPNGNHELIGGTGAVIGKGSKPRRFYFDSETARAIQEYLSTRQDDSQPLFLSERRQRMSMRAIQFTLAFWCTKLGLPHMHPHQLRHTFATTLANGQIQSRVLQELMGHSHFNTTTKYFRLTDQTTAREYYAAMELAHPPEA
jgi:site-specific recombinase XerC